MSICRHCGKGIILVPVRMLAPVEMWVHSETNVELCSITHAEPCALDTVTKP